MDPAEQSHALLEHTRRYFELHANQRMSVFNFFLLLSGAIATGIAATLQGSVRFAIVGVVLGCLLTLVAFVFWKLDQRVAFLIKHGETGLAVVERTLPEPSARLFLTEPARTDAAKADAKWFARQWSYGRAFRLVFWAMGLTGFAGAVLSGLKAACVVTL